LRWLLRKLGMIPTIPYRKLKMGLVKEYSIIIPKTERELFEKQGWIEAADFRDFHYYPDEDQTVMLSRPLTLSDRPDPGLVGNRITSFSNSHGSYGMGGPGFFGISLDNHPIEQQVLIYAVWGAGEYVLVDGREISCNPRYYDDRHPWLSFFADEEIPNWDDLTPILVGAEIVNIEVTRNRLVLHLLNGGQQHKMEMLQNDPRLPQQGNGEPRRDAFSSGSISEYILFQHPDAVLWV